MSTDANAALAWPIEITEFALIGDQVAHDLDQPDLFESPIRDRHFGWTAWNLNEDERPALKLCGTDVPGNIRLPALYNDVPVGSGRSHPEAGMWWSEAAMAWRVRPFLGDPLGDPRVMSEGTETGYWAITAEGTKLLPDSRCAGFVSKQELSDRFEELSDRFEELFGEFPAGLTRDQIRERVYGQESGDDHD